jgi:hyperosmotically inducible periplasmic protein
MRTAVIALCVAGLAACDGLSINQKKQSEAQPAAAQSKTPEAQAPRIDPDKMLASRVKQALEGEAKIHAAGIDVTAADGAITLWGTTASADERARAAKLASGVEGVKAVENRIAVVKGS